MDWLQNRRFSPSQRGTCICIRFWFLHSLWRRSQIVRSVDLVCTKVHVFFSIILISFFKHTSKFKLLTCPPPPPTNWAAYLNTGQLLASVLHVCLLSLFKWVNVSCLRILQLFTIGIVCWCPRLRWPITLICSDYNFHGQLSDMCLLENMSISRPWFKVSNRGIFHCCGGVVYAYARSDS